MYSIQIKNVDIGLFRHNSYTILKLLLEML